jgi:hypothetical protein
VFVTLLLVLVALLADHDPIELCNEVSVRCDHVHLW